MELSKLGALWSLMTGGWAGLVTYVLEAINKVLKKLDPTKLAQVSDVVVAIGNALNALLVVVPEKYRNPIKVTLDAVNKLAESLKDGEMTADELDVEIDAIEAAIEAWKNIGK